MRKSLFVALFSFVLLISLSASSAPPGSVNDHTSISADVGWHNALTIVSISDADYQFVAECQAILVRTIRYERRRTTSHDVARNRYMRQKYGSNAKEAQTIYKPDTADPLPDTDNIDTEIWQWLASNVKDQA